METLTIPIGDDDDLVEVGAHPKIRRIYDYWQSVHPPEGLPAHRHIDLAPIRDLLPGIWQVDVQRTPFRLHYRLVGTRVIEAMGRDVTGQWFDEAHPHIAQNPNYLERSKQVVETQTPSWRRGGPHLWQHEFYGSLENLILPLAEDGRNVDVLMVLTVFYRRDGQAS